MSRILVAAVLVMAALAGGCTTTQVVRIPVTPQMDQREDPPSAVVSHVSVAVIRQRVVNDSDRRVDLTNAFGESYATQSHLAHAVPTALTEVGFRVMEVASAEEARTLGADYTLMLENPQVDAFHPAKGSRTTLVGSAYDVRVHYSARMTGVDGRPLGLVSGFGQETRRFPFMEPLFRDAMVGAVVSLAIFGASILALAAVFQVGLLGNLAGRGDLFGVCTDNGPLLKYTPPVPNTPVYNRNDLCVDTANYGVYFLFVSALSLGTAAAGNVAGTVGGTLLDVFVAGMHITAVDPLWRGMVQDAHDDAARSLADDMARRVIAVRRTLPPVEAAPAPEPPQQAPAAAAKEAAPSDAKRPQPAPEAPAEAPVETPPSPPAPAPAPTESPQSQPAPAAPSSVPAPQTP